MNRKRKIFFLLLIATIACGILSRMIHTNSAIFNKYLGDGLYAIMFYLFFGIAKVDLAPVKNAIFTMICMIGIELFQLTLIPLSMSKSPNIIIKTTSVLLGTRFSIYDLISYFIGILVIFSIDRACFTQKQPAMATLWPDNKFWR